ncbi:glutamate racemase [Photobacterium ganghwense]|uniref:glutamate racemase n=1 Tax=Photobacterium ganghwense TaxID=320778 RepID=UPI001C2DE29F|nr:glutamate racemase [Photobacterium ganghwense]MBV1840040.1 glutamate racemase [Photobacterium ganghwense]
MVKRVLIFDSGVGGLSVYQEIYAQLPDVQYIYTFDDAAFRYGELPESELIERTSYIVNLLVARHQIDLVVVACNTASTIVLPTLRGQLTIPVVGVVPAIKPAALLSQQKVIGLLATPATVQRAYTDSLIRQFARDCEVLRIGSTRLVEMAEQKLRGEAVDLEELREILSPWRQRVDCIVLGCTHFPLIKAEIQQAFEQPVQIVDSGKAIANRVKALLGEIPCERKEPNLTYNSAAVLPAALNTSLQAMHLQTIKSLDYPRS